MLAESELRILEACASPFLNAHIFRSSVRSEFDNDCRNLVEANGVRLWRPDIILKHGTNNYDHSRNELFRLNPETEEISQYRRYNTGIAFGQETLSLAFGDFDYQLGVCSKGIPDEVDWRNFFSSVNSACIVLASQPELSQWVQFSTWAIAPTYSPGSSSFSGSSSMLPGIYHCEFGAPSVVIAETMVHESSHQWYFIGEQNWAFINDGDKKLYYSPFKGMDRPLRTILQTYHAFVNVEAFYSSRAWLQPDFDVEDGSFMAHLCENLNTIETHIKNSSGLTDEGRTFFNLIASVRKSGATLT